MKSSIKKLVAIVLTVLMAISTMPLTALADETVVAKIGDTEYTDLQTAFDAVKDGDTITICEDVTCADGTQLKIKKPVNFDIDGQNHTITGTTSSALDIFFDFDPSLTKGAPEGAYSMDIKDLNINTTGYRYSVAFDANGSTVCTKGSMTNCTINGDGSCLGVCGDKYGNSIVDVYDCTMTTTLAAVPYNFSWCRGLFTPQYNGTINVHSGTYTVNSQETRPTVTSSHPQDDYVVYVQSSGGYFNMYGGTLEIKGSNRANDGLFAERFEEGSSYPSRETCKSEVNIYGGEVKGGANCCLNYKVVNSATIAGHQFLNVFGGEYNIDPTDYAVEGAEITGSYSVNGNDIAQIGLTRYQSLYDAVDNAKSGDVIELLADTENVDIPDGVTLCKNGHNLTESQYVARIKLSETSYVYYSDFEDAAASATEGQTITLLKDVDLTKYAYNKFHSINFADEVTVDLNGKTIKSNNGGVAYQGINVTIKNGSLDSNNGSYALFIGNGELETSITVTDVTFINGGVNVFCADATLINCTISAVSYYAVWGDEDSNIDIISGTYDTLCTKGNKAILEAYDSGNINVYGGYFTANEYAKTCIDGEKDVTLYGGKYTEDPSAFIANGYMKRSISEDPYIYEVYCPSTASITVKDDLSSNTYIDLGSIAESLSTDENTVKATDLVVDVTHVVTDEDETTYPNYGDFGTTTDTYAGDTLETVAVSGEEGVYMFAYDANPAQLAEDATINVKNGSDVVYSLTYSMKDYCNRLIETGVEKNITLGNRMKDYAAAAQTYFNAYTDHSANDGVYQEDVEPLATTDMTNVKSGAKITQGAAGMTVTSVSFMSLANSGLNFDFKLADGYTLDNYSISFSGVDGSSMNAYFDTYKTRNMISVSGIEAKNLDEMFTVTITNTSDNSQTVITFSGLTYAKMVMNNSTDTNLIKFAQTLYLYNDAANTYFAS